MPLVTNEVLNYISIIMVGIIPIALIYYNKLIERRRVIKEQQVADDLRNETERKAAALKEANEEIARDIKEKLEASQVTISEKLVKSNEDILLKLEHANGELMTKLDSSVNYLNDRIDDLAERQEEFNKKHTNLINDLQHRAEDSNTMVNDIRNDVYEIQDVVESAPPPRPRRTSRIPPPNIRSKRRRP